MLEGSAGDGVVYIPNETQPAVRGMCALKQPELCTWDMGWRTRGVLLWPHTSGFAFSHV